VISARHASIATTATRRAGNLAALSALAFVILFWVSSEIASVRAQSPWSEDPWDAVLSVAVLVLPFVAIVTFVRAQRWRGSVPVPTFAHQQVLRGIGVSLALIGVGTAAAASALLAGVRSAGWGTATPLLGGLVALNVALWVGAVTGLIPAWRALPPIRPSTAEPDALDDAIALARDVLGWTARRLPSVARGGVHSLDWLDRFLEASRLSPRAHPHLVGLLAGAVFGAAFSTWHALVEGIPADGRAFAVWTVYAVMSGVVAAGAYTVLRRYLHLVGRS
jgi:hypothetical protein